jgi:hypothetical protein
MHWELPTGVHAVCTTRVGGMSTAPFDGFNLAEHVGDDPQAVIRNRELLHSQLDGARPVFLSQVHGMNVVELAATTSDGIQADACFTLAKHVACTVMVADCLPVLLCDASGQWVANRVEAGKRPRSSMAPIIVTKNKQLMMLVGSPGGSSIINFVAKTLIGVIDWNLNAYEAIKLPNMGSRNRDTEIERGTALETLVPALREKGHRVNVFAMPSGVQAIVRDVSGLTGGADPRREGYALAW